VKFDIFTSDSDSTL